MVKAQTAKCLRIAGPGSARLREQASAALRALTPRQLQVLRLRAEGLCIKEIAVAMSRSFKTVEYHWRAICQVTGLNDVAKLTQLALAGGLARWTVFTALVLWTALAGAAQMPAADGQWQTAGISWRLGNVAGTLRPATNSLSFAWDRESDPSVRGYRFYYGGRSRVYTNVVDVGSANTATVNGLLVGSNYFFAVTAYNAVGLESPMSVEISAVVPAVPAPTVVVEVGVVVEASGDLREWRPVTNWNWLTLTNPSGQQFFRARMTTTNRVEATR